MNAMRRLKRAMLLIAFGVILSIGSGAMAQPSGSGPAAAGPVEATPAGSATAPRDGVSPSASVGNAQSASSGSGAGYTWHERPARGKHHKARDAKVDPKLSQAKGPEFALGADGTSHITVFLSRKVGFRTESARRSFFVDLDQAQVAVLNDRNPLITTHFATPVEDARLVPHKHGVRLVIDLRESVTPSVSMKDAEAGASVLEVILPKTSRKSVPVMESSRAKGKIRTQTKSRFPKGPSVTPQNGMGPRL